MNQTENRNRLTGHVLALLTVLAWGTSYIITKKLFAQLPSVQILWIRFLTAYGLLWILYPKWHFNLREEGFFLLAGVLANTLNFLFENGALLYTQSSNVSIIASTIPIVTAVLLRFVDGTRVGRKQGTGYLIALVGVILVVFNGVLLLRLNPLGDLLAFLATVSWSVYTILMRKRVHLYDDFLIARKLMFYGLITITPVMLIRDGFPDISVVSAWPNWIMLLHLGLVCSGICYVTWSSAMRRIGVLTLNIYLYAMPLFTLVAGAVFLGEKITWMGIAGMILVCAGMLLGTVRGPDTDIGQTEERIEG